MIRCGQVNEFQFTIRMNSEQQYRKQCEKSKQSNAQDIKRVRKRYFKNLVHFEIVKYG